MVSSKPRIPAPLAPLLVQIDRYIRQYNLRGRDLASAASDVLDGLVLRHEIEPLVRRRLLTVIQYNADEAAGWWSRDPTTMCGRRYTVHLTERAMRALWPDRTPGVEEPAAVADNELPGMWEKADFEGDHEEVRGPGWKRPTPGVGWPDGPSDQRRSDETTD